MGERAVNPSEEVVVYMESREPPHREKVVKDILATTLELAKELQRELGKLQQIVDSSLPPGASRE